MFLYSAVSSPLDRSKRSTLFLRWKTCSLRHQLGFSWKHSSDAAIAQRLFTHMSTTVYSQVLIYTAEWRERKYQIFKTVAKGDSNSGSLDCESGILPVSYRTRKKMYKYVILFINYKHSGTLVRVTSSLRLPLLNAKLCSLRI